MEAIELKLNIVQNYLCMNIYTSNCNSLNEFEDIFSISLKTLSRMLPIIKLRLHRSWSTKIFLHYSTILISYSSSLYQVFNLTHCPNRTSVSFVLQLHLHSETDLWRLLVGESSRVMYVQEWQQIFSPSAMSIFIFCPNVIAIFYIQIMASMVELFRFEW